MLGTEPEEWFSEAESESFKKRLLGAETWGESIEFGN